MEIAMKEVRYQKVCKAYIAVYEGEYRMLLDDYIYHGDDDLFPKMIADKTHR